MMQLCDPIANLSQLSDFCERACVERALGFVTRPDQIHVRAFFFFFKGTDLDTCFAQRTGRRDRSENSEEF